jgi:hypothetical protein
MTEIAEIEDPELHRSRDRAIRLFEYLEPRPRIRSPPLDVELLSTGHSPKRDSPPLARTLASIRQKNTSAPTT